MLSYPSYFGAAYYRLLSPNERMHAICTEHIIIVVKCFCATLVLGLNCQFFFKLLAISQCYC